MINAKQNILDDDASYAHTGVCRLYWKELRKRAEFSITQSLSVVNQHYISKDNLLVSLMIHNLRFLYIFSNLYT